jgi:hypothetical protein
MNATIETSLKFYFATLKIYIYIYSKITLHYLEKREKKVIKGEGNT